MADLRLVRKGMDEPRDALVEQGQVSAALAEHPDNAAALAAHNWPPERTTELKELVEQLKSEVAVKAEAQRLAASAGEAKEIAIDDAKAFIRTLRYSLPECLRKTSVTTVNAASFEVGGKPLRRNPARIAAYLVKISKAVEALDADLAPFFGGTSPSTLLAARLTALEVANTARRVEVSLLPEATQRVSEIKGRLLEGIEDLNRAARRAFDGDAVKIAQFNKDILLRARRARKRTAQGEPTETNA